MEGISSNAEADEAIITRKRQWETGSWTSWKVLEGLLRHEMSDSERFDLLEAFGSCRSVRSVNTNDLRGCFRSILEWETLLRQLKFNPFLEEITVTFDERDESMMSTTSNIRRCWGEVLANSSTLKKLEITGSANPLPKSREVEGYYARHRSGLFLEELAQGLRSNSKSPLEELVIEPLSSSVSVVQLADMVQYSSRLHRFSWNGSQDLDGTEIQALSDALKQSSSLRTIEVKDGGESMSAVLRQVFTGVGSSRSVTHLHLWAGYFDGLGSVLPRLLKARIPHVHVSIFFSSRFLNKALLWRTYPWREIGRALLEGTSVQTLSLQMVGGIHPRRSMLYYIKLAEQVLETSQRSRKLSFSLGIYVGSRAQDEEHLIMSLLGLARLTDIHLNIGDGENLALLEKVMQTIIKNEDVEACSVGSSRWSGKAVGVADQKLVLEKIFLSSSIKQLTLKRSFFDGGNVAGEFKQLMLLLNTNTTLQKVEVQCENWVLDGKLALLQESINRLANRNARLAHFTSIVRQEGLHFSQIKAGRILICGSPFAGKTKLRKSMLEVAENGHVHWRTANVKRRTKGIEISTLRDDKEMNLTLWDLGGQWIFRSLQDLLFPKAGLACIFVFVFNPVETVDGRPCKRADLPSVFRKELKSWLRFVASNYPVATDLPPQMMVVLSHKDKMQECDRNLGWAREIVLQLQTSFQGKVDLSLREDLQFINSFSSEDVRGIIECLMRRIQSVFDILLERELIPSPAIQLTSFFTRRSDNVRKKPVWSSSELIKFFRSHITGLQQLDPETENGCKILQSLAQYLYDAGAVIRIPDSDFVVVDPNWMTERFLGELINYGHDFQPGILQNLSGKLGRDGFVDAQVFDSLLATLSTKYLQEGIQVPVDVLREFLFKLDLCFEMVGDHEVDGNRRYFMPSVCGSTEEKFPLNRLQWSASCHENPTDFGFRLQCYDRETTCFTRSFFPTFQVKLRNVLVLKRIADVRCSWGLMEIRGDGHEIFVESDELGEDHIDIMVRSSPYKSKEEAEEFVQENVIDFLRSFCASEMGCMGVSLSLHILRIQCVTQLIPRDYRGDNQAISVVELKNKVEADARKKLEACDRKKVKFHTWLESCVEAGLRYAHWWPEISCPDSQTRLLTGSEVAKDLLPIKVQKSIRRELETIAHDLEKEMYFRRRTQQDASGVERVNDEVFEVYTPVGIPDLELIFVHGIHDDEMDSKPYLTRWSTRDNKEECWLNTWLLSQTDVDLRQARILTVTYDSSIKKNSEKGNMCIYLVAENLRSSLIRDAGVGQHDSCPVLIVCHSLGGLLMKEVCVQASRVQSRQEDMVKYKNFLSNVKGFFFYSTPHSGLKLFGSGGSFSLVSQPELQDYSVEPRNSLPETGKMTLTGESSTHLPLFQLGDLMKRLELYDASCARTNGEFENLRAREEYKWEVRGVCESNPTKVPISKDAAVEIFVEEGSARPGCLHGFLILPNTNHFTICRPESVTSNSFQLLLTFIQELVYNH